MLLVATHVAPSSIAGLGLFAAEPVAAGQVIWRFEPKFDQLLDIDDVRAMPAAFRAFFDMYCYEAHAFPGRYVLLCDPASTSAEPLVAKLLLDPAPDLASVWQHAGFARMTLAEILAPAPVVA